MTSLDKIKDGFPSEEFTIADGFDDAIIGVNESNMTIVYSISKCIQILVSQGIDEGEAVEYLYFNTIGAYIGEKTPIWVNDLF
jgi:hypothetical protein